MPLAGRNTDIPFDLSLMLQAGSGYFYAEICCNGYQTEETIHSTGKCDFTILLFIILCGVAERRLRFMAAVQLRVRAATKPATIRATTNAVSIAARRRAWRKHVKGEGQGHSRLGSISDSLPIFSRQKNINQSA